MFTSAYRGVTRHRLTGRYEAHYWDSSYVRPNVVSWIVPFRGRLGMLDAVVRPTVGQLQYQSSTGSGSPAQDLMTC